MLVLAVADAHIPERATAVPESLRRLLIPEKIDQVACLGNIGDEVMRILRPLGTLRAVRGEFDTGPDSDLPLDYVLKTPWLNIGLVSGATIVPHDDPDALAAVARKLNVDVLLWGGSHNSDAHELGGKLFVNPGSLTGVWPVIGEAGPPGFCLLDIGPGGCTVFFYSLVEGRVNVDKVVFKR